MVLLSKSLECPTKLFAFDEDAFVSSDDDDTSFSSSSSMKKKTLKQSLVKLKKKRNHHSDEQENENENESMDDLNLDLDFDLTQDGLQPLTLTTVENKLNEFKKLLSSSTLSSDLKKLKSKNLKATLEDDNSNSDLNQKSNHNEKNSKDLQKKKIKSLKDDEGFTSSIEKNSDSEKMDEDSNSETNDQSEIDTNDDDWSQSDDESDGMGEHQDILKEKDTLRKQDFFELPPTSSNLADDTVLSFSQMNLSRPILKALANMGLATPTPIQSKVIPYALLGKDIVASAITGSGKTLAFLLPIVERLLFRPKSVPVTRVLILVPTRELAMQCHQVARQVCSTLDIQTGLAVGGMHVKQQEAEIKRRPDILVATPGRLIDFLQNTPGFTLEAIDILVLDEADRMLEDGFHDELHEIIKHTPRSRQTILVSATMTDNVQKLITLSLTRPVRVFVDPVASTSLKLSQEFIRVRPHREQEKLAFLLALCRRTVLTNAIVFFNLKKTVHEAYLVFQLLGFQVAELHGDLSQPQRVRSLDQFRQREVDFLFATDVASRGLDIPFVKCVINIDMPSTMEIYLHRVGRTARAGRPGRSISLITESDRGLLRTLLSKPTLQMHQRVIRKEVLQKYARKLEKAKTKVPALLEEEKKEKQLNLLEMQLKKADNMIQHKEEIMSRPKRVWFKKETPQTPSTPKSKSRKRRRTKE